MTRGRRVASDRPEGLHIPVRLFDRVRAVFGLPEMPVIVADEIARQIDALPDAPAHWSPPAEHYGCVAPPFARWFIEASTVTTAGPYTYPTGRIQQFEATVPGVILAPLDTPPGPKRTGPVMPQWAAPNHLPYALKALAAMHQRCPVERVVPGPDQRRRVERKARVQLHEYYLLKVRPTPTERIEDFQRIGTPERARPREHLRYYTEERRLFGRVAGMVWVPEHERGSDELGTIRKDYEVSE